MIQNGRGVWARQPLLGAICGIESRVRRAALMQLIKEGFLLRMEQKRQMGKVMRLLTAKPGDRGGIRRAGRQGGIQ
jgi:hypothetical protein